MQVGSAAFNLLCITAVCVSAIPEGEVRRIKDIGETPACILVYSCILFSACHVLLEMVIAPGFALIFLAGLCCHSKFLCVCLLVAASHLHAVDS